MILSLRIMLQFVSSNRYMADHATICVLQPRSPNITSCCSLPRHSPSGGGVPPNRRSNGVSTTHVEAYRAAAPALQVFSLSLATISSHPTCTFLYLEVQSGEKALETTKRAFGLLQPKTRQSRTLCMYAHRSRLSHSTR